MDQDKELTVKATERPHAHRGSEGRIQILYILFMVVIFLFSMADQYLDRLSGWALLHSAMEFAIMTFALVSATYIWYSFRHSQKRLRHTEQLLGDSVREMEEWRSQHAGVISGMQEAIRSQFVRWGLSPSEIDVAIYLIRGYSHKQISGLLEKSERTVRNQSLNIYKKTGMTGRSELAAFFLEDLFQMEDPEEEEDDTKELEELEELEEIEEVNEREGKD